MANKYLLPHEQQTIAIHSHPAALIPPIVLVLAGLTAAGAVSQVPGVSGDAVLITWLIWVLLVLYLIGKVVKWSTGYYVITSERILSITGLFTRDVTMIPLFLIAGMKFKQSTIGRLFGYGRLIFEPYGQSQTLHVIGFAPYPEQLYLEITSLIFPNREAYADADGPRGNEPELALAQQPANEVNAEHYGGDKDEERSP